MRYLNGQSGSVLASRRIEVTPVTAQLQMAESIPAGSEFEVTWDGPDNVHDRLAVAPVNAEPHKTLNWRYTTKGSPATVRAPDDAGDYEVRYLSGQSGSVLASRRFVVTPVTAQLRVADSVRAGNEFEVAWDGPNNVQDRIAVTPVDSEPHKTINWRYTTAGSPLMLKAPKQPGDYEVRYISGQSYTIFARERIEVE